MTAGDLEFSTLSAVIDRRYSAKPSRVERLSGDLFQMTAELVTHRREQLVLAIRAPRNKDRS
jgi:hypothetical protein